MPVHAARVSLATAKDWAKRLAKTSHSTDPAHSWPLARCQLAVATMLGFDHWHALHQGLAAPSTPAPPSAPPVLDLPPNALDHPLRRTPQTLQEVNLPAPVLQTLRKLCSFPTGMFFFTGTAGAGKGTLLHHVVADRTGFDTTRTFILEPIWCPTSLPGQAPSSGVMVMPEIRRENASALLAEAKTKPVFATAHAAQGRLPDRLEDFQISSEDCRRHLRGWCYVKLVPLLCRHCSAPSPHHFGARVAGPGCDQCSGWGATGRQQVADVWCLENNTPRQLFSCMDQTRALVRTGLVAQSDAEELLGYLGL